MGFLPAAARDFFPRPGVRCVDVTDLPPSASAVAWFARNRDRPTVAAVRRAATAVTRSRRRPGPPGDPGRGAARPPSGTG
ncbi:hypothetical protein [Streptomyces sp. ICN903]|uniref:hypothetical protein n=1 Tax=Streptomyces sp. ICN903 TaxID=2964654 RepID=UPI0027E56615|nr:hypothetical protein [Streptomyces sp. ICN903]